MEIALTIVVCFALLAVIMWALMWLARRVRSSGKGANVMGPIDEIYNVAAHRWRPEVEIHEQRMVPLPGQPTPDNPSRSSTRDTRASSSDMNVPKSPPGR